MTPEYIRPKNSYVYTLSYPESMGSAVFYVGKGQGDRFKDHMAQAKRGVQSAKCDIIRSIWERGEGVVMDKIFEELDDLEALKLEKEVIHAIGYENLVNSPPRTKDRTYKGLDTSSTQISYCF